MYRWPCGRPLPESACLCGGKGDHCADDGREVFCRDCPAGDVRWLVEARDLDWDEACLRVTGMTRADAAKHESALPWVRQERGGRR